MMSKVLLGLVVVWIPVALFIHWRRAEYYRKNPYAWARRGDGLIAFNDRQVYWMTNLWPLTVAATILYILLCWVMLMVEWGQTKLKGM
jgi:hypothetical protein